MNSLTQILRHYDFSIYYYLYRHGTDAYLLGRFYFFFAKYGIVLFLFSFTYLIWMKKINAFLCSFIAMGIGAFLDLLIFTVWRRPSPFIAHKDVISIADDLNGGRISSFPSSHTYIVFAIATSVYLYGHKRLGALLFILAICVALGRIGTGLHYPSDTIAGAVLGILSGVLAYRFVHKNEKYWEYEDTGESDKAKGESERSI